MLLYMRYLNHPLKLPGFVFIKPGAEGTPEKSTGVGAEGARLFKNG